MSFKGLRGFKQSSVLSPKIRKMVESGLTPVRPSNTPLVPTLVLSFTSVDEGSTTGRYVGTPYVVNGKGTYTITEIADPDNKFTITGGDLVTSASLDYGVKTSHLVTLRASNGVDANIDQQFTINVNNVFEGVLGPVSANFYYLAAENAVITTITGLDSEVAESIAAISPNDGRLAFNANQILKGPSAVTEGVINAIVTTTQGRTLEIALTALDVSWANIGTLFNDGAIDGIMIDLTDKTTLFQDANGAAAVVSNGDPIGLALDQHKWGGKTLAAYRAAQPELITNGTFDTDVSGWSVSGTGTLSWQSGKLRMTTTSGTPYFYASFPAVNGRWYEISFDFVAKSGTGDPRFYSASSAGNGTQPDIASGFGTYRRFVKATSATMFLTIQHISGTAWSEWDNFSVKEIDGHHATQTSTARPTWASATGDALFDGTNDFLSTDYISLSADTFLAGLAKTSVTGFNIQIAGAQVSSSSRFTVGKRSNDVGYTNAGSNVVNGVTSLPTVDYSSVLADVSIDTDLFYNGVLENSVVTSDNAMPAYPFFIGAFNNIGSASGHWTGNIKRVVAGSFHLQDVMSAAEFHANMIA